MWCRRSDISRLTHGYAPANTTGIPAITTAQVTNVERAPVIRLT